MRTNFTSLSPHHRSLFIFAIVVGGYFVYNYMKKGKSAVNSMEVVWAGVAGALAVEGVKVYTKIQGGAT